MRKRLVLAAAMVIASGGLAAPAQDGPARPPIEELPRHETLVVENPEGSVADPGWFNVWVDAGGGRSTGLRQLVMDTLWHLDPDGTLRSSLAAGPPAYSADFTRMTIDLREDLRWSDGEPFDAGDLVFTVETHMAIPDLIWSEAFTDRIAGIDRLGDHAVRFRFRGPEPGFHAAFVAFGDAVWIMPEHVFAAVEDILVYDNNPPVGLGPYMLHAFDPHGAWHIWERREDWERSAMAGSGEPGPRYVIYRDGGALGHRLAEMRNGDLDVIHDLPAAAAALLAEEVAARGWSDDPAPAYPDPALATVLLDHLGGGLANPRLRWALALMPAFPAAPRDRFPVLSERHWTGYPSAADPYAAPLADRIGWREVLARLVPAGD